MIPGTLLLFAALLPADAPKADLDRRLARPLSPGAVALLVRDAKEPAVVGRLAEALRDKRSETRAAAARVVLVSSLRDLQKALEDALAEESDPEAAREQIRALAAIMEPPNDQSLLTAADRFEGHLDPDLADILARQRGRGAMPSLLSARRWNLTPNEWAEAVWLAARGDAEALVPALSRALGTGDRQRWNALLRLLVSQDFVAGRNVVAVGLSSNLPGMAARAAWYLTWVRLRAPLETDRERIESFDPPEGADLDTQFLFDVLGRTFLEPPRDTSPWVASLETAKNSVADDVRPGSLVLAILSADEREAIRRRYNRRQGVKPEEAKRARSSWDAPAKKPAPERDYGFVLRTVSGLPRGVASDALQVAGCRPRRGEIFGMAAVRYGPDGRPREVGPYETVASSDCEAVALALVAMTLAPNDDFPVGDKPSVLFGMARSDCLSALEEPDVCPTVCPEDRDSVRTVGGEVKPPVLEDRVEPVYTKQARRAGKEGAVRVVAIITDEGCVREVRIAGAVDPSLDFEAARAVAQWKYRPATYGDRPVSVYLTVTVTFRLR